MSQIQSPHERPRAILFDLDDTLWPIGPVIAEAELTLHAWLAEHAPKVAQAFTIDDLRARRMALLAADPAIRAAVVTATSLCVTEPRSRSVCGRSSKRGASAPSRRRSKTSAR